MIKASAGRSKENPRDARGIGVVLRFPSARRGLRATATPCRVRERFPARGVQRTVVVLWTPEAPVHGTSAGMKNPDRLEERSGFVWMSSTNGLFIGFAAMADTEDLDGDHLVSQ